MLNRLLITLFAIFMFFPLPVGLGWVYNKLIFHFTQPEATFMKDLAGLWLMGGIVTFVVVFSIAAIRKWILWIINGD